MPPPVVSNLQVLNGLTSPAMNADHRIAVLKAQDSLWSDDEIRWHLERILQRNEDPTKVLLDPLLATHVMTSGQTGLIFRWVQQLRPKIKMIVTAVWTQGHWTPYAWTWNEQCLIAHSWDVQGTAISCNLLHDALAKAVGARTFMGHTAHRQFAENTLCGVCAVRWLDHFISGKMLPSNLSEAEQLNQVAKQMFVEFLQASNAVARPWIWASGLDALVNARLLDLLQQHGVPKSEVDQRAKVIVNAIGVPSVQRAVTGTAPWRSLKALANQADPVVQLVMPDELAEVIKQRAESGGDKSTKQKRKGDKGKTNHMAPAQLDPAKVQIAPGVFVDEANKTVPQIAAATLGPLATGVALATFDEVAPFLKAGKQVSKDSLAVFIMNAVEAQMETLLPWFQCRIAARCIANGEPLLITGYLVQLGMVTVSLAKKQTIVEAGDVQAACVKAAIYRDSFVGNWEDLIKAPVRFVLQCLIPLQVCDADVPCSCGKWHKKADSPVKDPVLDVWRRQWLSLSFRPTTPTQADVFVVNVRYVHEAEHAVLSQSGINGLFLEPRSLDSKLPTNDFQVLWMPRSNLTELNHLRQTVPDIVGIARLGARLGLRTTVLHAAEVGQAVKPDVILLQTGNQTEYEVGPVPYGMDRAAVASLCASMGWKAKPITPIKSLEGSLGILWLVRTNTEPLHTVFATKHGDVVVTKRETKAPTNMSRRLPAIASEATMQLCTLQTSVPKGEDPLMKNDPWGPAVNKLKLSPIVPDPVAQLQQVEDRIERAVLAKIPKPVEAMEVDSAAVHPDYSHRLEQLEAQVSKLTAGHAVIETKLEESQKRSDAQFNQMQHQVAVQLESQSSHMEELFRSQLSQIESILGKRARTE